MPDPPRPDPDRPDAPGSALFASLLAAAQEQLRGFVCGMVGSVEQAQDITQDVFVDAWRAATRGQAPFDGAGDEPAMRRWLFHVAYQRAVSALRHGAVLHFESLDARLLPDPDRLYDPTPFEDRIAEGEALQGALDTLGPQDAACLLLSVVQGFTALEVAAILEITPAAAKKRLTRAKQRLRSAYFACQKHETTGRKGWEVRRSVSIPHPRPCRRLGRFAQRTLHCCRCSVRRPCRLNRRSPFAHTWRTAPGARTNLQPMRSWRRRCAGIMLRSRLPSR